MGMPRSEELVGSLSLAVFEAKAPWALSRNRATALGI